LLRGSDTPILQWCFSRSPSISLMRTACQHLLRVQKSLDQMNMQLHHAVTDITGTTGLAILDAIVAGERDPKVLARLRDYRCKKSEAAIAKALRGDWREEHLFTLRQSLQAWRFHQNLMTDCEQEIAALMADLEDRPLVPAPETGKTPKKVRDEPMRQQLREKFGVDLTAVEGVSIQTCLTFFERSGYRCR
jgi:hypothetical protein